MTDKQPLESFANVEGERPSLESFVSSSKPEKGIVGKVADFIGLGSTIETVNLVNESPILGKAAENTDANVKKLASQSRDLILKAKRENDPEKKREFLQRSREVDLQIDGAGEGIRMFTDLVQAKGGITDEDMGRSNEGLAFRKGLATATEIGSFLVPFTAEAKALTAAAKSGSVLKKMLASGKIGGTTAAILGFGSETNDGLDERLVTAVESGALGAGVAAFLTGGFEGAKWAKKQIGKPFAWMQDKIGKQQLGKTMALTDSVIKEADRIGVSPSDELISRELVDEDLFKRIPKTVKFKDPITGKVTGTKQVFEYGGQKNANKLIKKQEKIIQAELKKRGNRFIIGATGLLDGMDEFIDDNAINVQEADAAKEWVRKNVKKAMPKGVSNATNAIETKRFLFKKFQGITDKSSLKRKAGERMASLFNKILKAKVPEIKAPLREEQILIFLRNDVIPKAGRNIYRNAERSLLGLSGSEATAVARGAVAPAVAGSAFGPGGAIAGLATQLPSIISKVAGPENIAARALAPQTATQASGDLLRNLGLTISGRAGATPFTQK